ncbi:uncharacterized protein LOC121370371 [Gigantopelta aegis]|uniref:uncharacterized protein LOC121370371 n=1 Tax=Gigantopelta aegis TaxID=1735272 RepID=UPI001B88AC0F|nr:uncharacterized protein LOC121370371 [Gigantopelta aegis]
MGTLTETIEQLKNAIDRNRTDIICTVISTWQKSATDSDLLQHCLDEPHVEDGTLLHYATRLERHDIVRALLASGADPCVQDSQGRLPLDLANDHIRSVYNEELLQATAQSNVGRVCQLLAAGVDINLIDSVETKNTPLHWAVCYGSRDVVQGLASRGADVNRVNAAGHTPLHDAIVRGDRGIVEELLLNGATVPQDSGDGSNNLQSLMELAAGNEEIVQLLKSPPKHLETLPALLQHKNHILDSRRNLVHFDSTASIESLTEPEMVNGTSETNGINSTEPQLSSPTFKKRTALFDELNIAPLKPVLTEEKLNLLWPQPQSIVQGGGKPFVIKDNLTVFVAGGPFCSHSEIISVWDVRRSCFQSLHVNIVVDVLTSLNTSDSPHVVCHVNTRLCPGKGSYKLTITPKQLKIVCGSVESLHYALSTLLQLLSLYQTEDSISVPTLLIDDWPELSYRGILLDFSQGRIPNMETLKEVLDQLSLLKINHIYLYTRFLAKHSQTWQFCFTRSDLLELDMFCKVRGLQLIPVLDIAPKVQFEDISSLYAVFQDYVTCFSNAEFVSVGPRLSSFVLDTSDENVIMDDSTKFLPSGSEKTLQLCSYPLHDLATNLLQQLPPHIIFNEYGVEADHDFTKFSSPMADLGIHFFVCPGTAAWNSLAGCPEAALKNIYNAIKSASTQGALGLVACNWTGRGHMTHLPFCWPGFLMAAGLSWNSDCHWDFLLANLADLLNEHVFLDEEQVVGQTVVELGRAETYLLRCSRNQAGDDCHNLTGEHGSLLFRFLLHPDDVPLEFLTADHIQRCMRHVKKCQGVLAKASLVCAQSSEILQELQLTCDVMCFAAKVARSLVLAGRKPNLRETGYNVVNFGIANLTPTTRTDLANRLLELLEVYEVVWDKRYLPQRGKQDSLSQLQNLLTLLVPGQSTENLTSSSEAS